MTDKRICYLVNSFRQKMERARIKDLFVGSILEKFPIQCCGVTSTLLAEFLLSYGVETLWISAEEFETRETHAWLVVKDDRIDFPHSCFNDVPNNIIGLLATYGGDSPESIREATCYIGQDIENGLIVDITGDQFNEASVYVGYMDNFHKRFAFVKAYEHEGLPNKEYARLYEIIICQ